MNRAFTKTSLGSQEIAEQVYQRAYKSVPAYEQFLTSHGLEGNEAFEKLPPTDKESYALAYPFEKIIADDFEECFSIFRSSGSSGNSFYWPQLKSASQSSPDALKAYLENTFAIHKKKTLAIVGLNLGAWIGGESFSWSLKNIAINSPYPFHIFSPGSHHEEIIEMICTMNSFVEQIILIIVPSAIAHLHLKANQLKKSFPFEKLKYIVTGEPFPESLRVSFQSHIGLEDDNPFMFSIYGSADTGSLGVESLATVALRKLLYRNNALASSLGIESPSPHFFHFLATDTYLETVDDHLCVTRWQGIPLVRYILYDRTALYSWRELKQAIINSENLTAEDELLVKLISDASDNLPDLIAVTGRADSCLILGSNKFTEYMLDAAVKSEELNDILTGLYCAQIIYEDDRQYLAFDLEIRQSFTADESIIDRAYYSLMKSLGEFQPIFLNQWQNIYSAWDNDPTKRILRLNFIPYPALSQTTEKTIKQRGIVKS
ncbi:MAG: hypothetical protein EAZ77_06565 [Nostocales cyanobacterium]|nr:MAG: hypothetical protein EAZ77_06565 [Nostocales cyanobacterium]